MRFPYNIHSLLCFLYNIHSLFVFLVRKFRQLVLIGSRQVAKKAVEKLKSMMARWE